MAEPLTFECPSCGSPVTTDGKELQVTCQYCGRVVTVPEALRPRGENAPAWQGSPVVVVDPREVIREAMQEREAERERAEARSRPAPRRRSSGCGCGMVPVLLLALALGAAYLYGPSKSVELLSAAAGLPTPKPTVAPVTRALEPPATQKVSYAGLQFTVTGGTLTNQPPADATSHERLLRADQANAYLNVKVNNPTGNGIEADQRLLALQLGNGQRYAEESGWADWVAAESSQEKRLYFRVPVTATWQGAQLVIGEAGKEPAALPLDGPAAAARYPADLKASGKATVRNVDYEIQSATLDLDYGGKRAATGRRFLMFKMRVFNHDPGGISVAVTSSNFRLAIGQDMLAPVDSMSEAIAASSVFQGQVVFDVPASAGKAELQVGEVGREATQRLPVTIPDR